MYISVVGIDVVAAVGVPALVLVREDVPVDGEVAVIVDIAAHIEDVYIDHQVELSG